jgi:hypothetical protein
MAAMSMILVALPANAATDLQLNTNAGSGSGSSTHNLRGARALALATTTSSGTIVYTEAGDRISVPTGSAPDDANRVVGAFATTVGMVSALVVYLL